MKRTERQQERGGEEREVRNISAGPFPSGEELVGFGNRERLREPPDIVI